MQVGMQAPDFTLTADDGSQVSLSDYRGQKVLIYFYPEADTPGCTKQACAVRDVYADVSADVTVIGISPDQPEALVKFRKKYGLPFILLSDPDHEVAKAYGAWGEKIRGGKASMGILRSHFGLDKEGKLVELKLEARPLTTAELAVRLVKV